LADPLGAWLLNATYADYDARKLDRQFQDSTGQTAVTASGDKVGLWLDGSQFGTKTLAQVVAGQAELNLNPGPFANAIGYTASSGTLAIVGDEIEQTTSAAAASVVSIPVTTVVGQFYVLQYDAHRGSSSTISIQAGTAAAGGAIASATISSATSVTGQIIFKATTTTTYLQMVNNQAVAGRTGYVRQLSCKAIPGNHGLQGTANSRLNYFVSGSRISLTADALDDNLLSSYLAGPGANSILFDIDVPATVSASQVVIGMSGSATARLSLGINTSGQLCAGVGSDANTTIVGSTDWRGQRLIAALSADGSTVKLLTANGEEYSAAQNGSPTTTIPARLAANNNNGTGSSFFGGGIARAIIAQKAMDLATFNAIRNQLLAS
jgi:hypothetical protein